MQKRARDAEALLLAERERPIPVRIFVEFWRKLWQSHGYQGIADLFRTERVFFRRVCNRGYQGADGEIRPLRQHHQRGLRGNRDRTGPEWPYPGDGAE